MSMNFKATAREIVKPVIIDDQGIMTYPGDSDCPLENLCQAIAAALLAARNEALEEAAQLAKWFADQCRADIGMDEDMADIPVSEWEGIACDAVAEEICCLKTTE